MDGARNRRESAQPSLPRTTSWPTWSRRRAGRRADGVAYGLAPIQRDFVHPFRSRRLTVRIRLE